MWYKITLTIVGIICGLSEWTQGQELHYRIVWKGDSIGYVTSQRLDSLDFEVFKIESRVSIWVFGRKKINYDFYSVYKDQELIRARTLNTKNQAVMGESSIQKKASTYLMNIDGEDKSYTDVFPIQASIVNLYHRPPTSAPTIFSERFGELLNVERIDDHHYTIEKPNGRTTDYYYRNGSCYLVEADSFFAKVRFELIP